MKNDYKKCLRPDSPVALPSSGYCLESARLSVSTTIRDMADINLKEEEMEEEEEEVEQHSWGHRPLEVIGGGDCSAEIPSCQ